MRQRFSMGFFGRRHAGQAEVEHLDVAVAPDHDVLGLDVAMHDAVRVGGGERAGDLAADVDDGVERQAGLCAQARAKRLAVDQFLHHVVPAIVVCPISWTVTMLGWLSADAARASRRNRSMAGIVSRPCRSIFRATGRLSVVSNARYTSPMPPRPSSPSIRYWAICEPIIESVGFDDRHLLHMHTSAEQ